MGGSAVSAPTASIRDARTLLGMHTRAAWAIAVLYLTAVTSLAVTSWHGVSHRWPIILALLITIVVTGALLTVRPDPLPPAITVAMALSGPVCCALVLFVLPVPPTSAWQTWPLASGTGTATYMCVRGRTAAAWVNLWGMIAVTALWSGATGQGAAHGVAISIVNLPPLLMATFFAYTIRPAARTIFELREESSRRIAAEAAVLARLAEREEQMRRLDRTVRPILQRITDSEPLDSATRLECKLLEAHLRDTLRAPSLVQGSLPAAARAARARGVEVIMLDDHGLDTADADTRERLSTFVAAELDRADAGTVTVRILPPDRGLLATILADHPTEGMRRIELGRHGVPLTSQTEQAAQERGLA